MNGLLFEEVFKSGLDFLRNKKVLSAFSGGNDSLSMTDFLNISRESYSFSLAACHVNHGLRAESGEDEEFCRKWCENNGIEFVSARLSFSKDYAVNGLEDWARRERYKALRKAAADIGADIIVTAHTLDDRLESFFTDLYTGASIFTLGGIARLRGDIYRPMLDISKEMAEDYLRRRGLVPVFDSSNNNERFVRNRIRRRVMPALFDAGKDFMFSVLRLQEESALLNGYFDGKTGKALLYESEDMTVLNGEIFFSFSRQEQAYLLGKIFSRRFRAGKNLINEGLSLLERAGSRRADMPGGYVFEVSRRFIRLYKKTLIGLFSVEKDKGIDTIRLLRAEVKFYGKYTDMPMIVRNRRNGDRFHGKKLKDIFIDKKTDPFERDSAVIIQNLSGEIVWAEGISIDDRNILVKRFDRW